jgi:hypothetical protein
MICSLAFGIIKETSERWFIATKTPEIIYFQLAGGILYHFAIVSKMNLAYREINQIIFLVVWLGVTIIIDILYLAIAVPNILGQCDNANICAGNIPLNRYIVNVILQSIVLIFLIFSFLHWIYLIVIIRRKKKRKHMRIQQRQD